MAKNQLTGKNVIEGFKRLVAMNSNNLDAVLDQLQVPPAERDEAKSSLEKLLSGDKTLLKELTDELITPSDRAGKTQFKVLKKWGINYGFRVYISHGIVQSSAKILGLASAVAAICGPQGAALVVPLSITMAALKVIDRGNGIMITQIPPMVGLCIPTPQ